MVKTNNEQLSSLVGIESEKQKVNNEISRLQNLRDEGKRVKGKLEQQEKYLQRLIKQGIKEVKRSMLEEVQPVNGN